jgi:endonuclease-8
MPEGPEAAAITKFLNSEFINLKLKNVEILKGRYLTHGAPNNFKEFITELPLKLIKIEKKGKVIFIYFENNWCIISKLGMTGWWYSTNHPSWRSEFKSVIFTFDNKELIYSDPRSYGTLTFTKDTNLIQKELNQLAPDIMSSTITSKIFTDKVKEITSKKPEMPIEELLSDQKKLISGIGNYLKSEILYNCKIAPMRKLKDITDSEWLQIYESSKLISSIMTKAIATKKEDEYESKMKVYNKKTDPLGNEVKKYSNKVNRTVHWVPEIQK